MVVLPRLRRWRNSLFSIGEYPGENDIQRGKRKIVVGYFFFGALTRFVVGYLERSRLRWQLTSWSAMISSASHAASFP